MMVTALVLVISRQFDNPSEENTKQEVKEESISKEEGILGNKADLVYFSIKPYDKVESNFSYSGAIQGGYFFEANILINILDENKNIVLRSYTTAKSDWMTAEPVAFDGTLDLSGLDAGSYYLEIHNDNASGLPENDKSILIPIIIN